MAKSISPQFFPSSRSTISPAGPSSNGNAASRAPNKAPPKALPSSRATSSKPPPPPSTISPPPAPTKPPTAKCSAWHKFFIFRSFTLLLQLSIEDQTNAHRRIRNSIFHPSPPPRHGRRRTRRLHRRRPSHRRAHRRPL